MRTLFRRLRASLTLPALPLEREIRELTQALHSLALAVR